MKISDVIKKYSIFKKASLQLFENADFAEIDMLINSLKKFKDYDISDFKKAIDSIDIHKIFQKTLMQDETIKLT